MIAFVSSPYTHPDPKIQDDRAKAAGDFAAYLWRERGAMVFSPIAHWHDIAKRNALPSNALAWRDWNLVVLCQCDVLYVLCIPGWRDSVGVAYEIQWANECEMKIFYATPEGKAYDIRRDPTA